MRLPLSALLSQVLISLSLEFERAGAGRSSTPGLEVWSNLLRCVGEDGVVERRLPELTRLSKRAVRSRVGNAIRRGWLRVESGEPASRAALLGLTERGREIRAAWPGLAAEAVRAWCARVGDEEAAALQAALRTLVGQLELELPHFPAGYGAADASITGHDGQDWRPVRRHGEDTVSDLAPSALLSQALVAYTMDYEADGGSLALSANVLRLLGRTGRPLADLPSQQADGLSALERHGYVETYRDPADGRTTLIRLTERGQRARHRYQPRLAAIDRRWDQRFDGAALRSSLESMARNLDLELPHHPIGVFDHRTGLFIRRRPGGVRSATGSARRTA